MTEPTSNSAPEESPAEVPSPDFEHPDSEHPDSEHADADDPAAAYPGFERPALPYIKQMPSRRKYDLQLLVPFCCIGASIGTLALTTGVARHVALIFAFVSLFCWIKAGVVTTARGHTNWLLGMWVAVVLFVGCGLISKLTHAT